MNQHQQRISSARSENSGGFTMKLWIRALVVRILDPDFFVRRELVLRQQSIVQIFERNCRAAARRCPEQRVGRVPVCSE